MIGMMNLLKSALVRVSRLLSKEPPKPQRILIHRYPRKAGKLAKYAVVEMPQNVYVEIHEYLDSPELFPPQWIETDLSGEPFISIQKHSISN